LEIEIKENDVEELAKKIEEERKKELIELLFIDTINLN